MSFISTYAALRLTGLPRRTLTGGAVRLLLVLAVSPIIAVVVIVQVLVQLVQLERQQPLRSAEALANDYAAWQVAQARANVLHRQRAAAARRQRSTTFHGHVDDLRRQMGERP